MLSTTHPLCRLLPFSLLCAVLFGVADMQAHQQQQSPTPSAPAEPSDEVVRVETELIQTDVMVFDNQGRFVNGLKPEQFLLRVDGRPQNILFFERVTAGSIDEEAQLAAARGGRAAKPGAAKPLDRGRSLFFFVDDLHLAHDSLNRTRETLLRFIENEMTQNDEAAVASASGRIGFLQQLTDEKAVLRRAVGRLSLTSARLIDSERPHMSEHQASAVEQNSIDVIAVFVDSILRDNPFLRRETAENMVRTRARNILQQSAGISTGTLASLETLVRTTAQLPGRKVIFFLSDGFFLDRNIGDAYDRLRRIGDAAARAGVVIYSMDTRGLVTGQRDAATDAPFDITGRLASHDLGEVAAQQAPLYALAADTGGRALVNTNNLGQVLTKAVQESAIYYLLAWQPASGEKRGKQQFRRIEVSVSARPDLKVQVRRGFYDKPVPAPTPENRKKKDEGTNAAAAKPLFQALTAAFPQTALPVSLTLNYLSTHESGMQLAATTQVSLPLATRTENRERTTTQVELIGAVYDERGKVVEPFQKLVSGAPRGSEDSGPVHLISTHQMKVNPGVYQVRVAAREPKSGQIGSATAWVVIPELTKGTLSLSSIFLGSRENTPPTGDQSSDAGQVLVSADRRFRRDSLLRLMVITYNARHGAAEQPDLALQFQILRDAQPVVTTPLRKIDLSGHTDFSSIPYAAELRLEDLPAGRYLMKVSVIDRLAKTSATQQTKFIIE